MRLRVISLTAPRSPAGRLGRAARPTFSQRTPSQEPPRPFKDYPAAEYTDFPLPPDWQKTTEWTRARLHYSSTRHRGFRGGDLNWTIDYPRSDRHLLEGVRRLTRIDTRSVEQVVDLDGEDDVYNWPMLYAVEVGYWRLSDEEAAQLREFILRGGFLMVDDFHSTYEWAGFIASMTKVFPDREVEDLPNDDPIFHTIYDLERALPGSRRAIPAQRPHLRERRDTAAPSTGARIRDDQGRVIVAICHNMDLGDAWEWSDDPHYDEKFASLAYRIAHELLHLRSDALSVWGRLATALIVNRPVRGPSLDRRLDRRVANPPQDAILPHIPILPHIAHDTVMISPSHVGTDISRRETPGHRRVPAGAVLEAAAQRDPDHVFLGRSHWISLLSEVLPRALAGGVGSAQDPAGIERRRPVSGGASGGSARRAERFFRRRRRHQRRSARTRSS